MKIATTTSPNSPTRGSRKTAFLVTIGIIAFGIVITATIFFRNPNVIPQSATEPHAEAHIVLGQIAPEFSVSSTAGLIDLATTKTPVFLEIFASWCPHCQRETRVINKLYARYGRQMTFIAVSGSALGTDGNTPETEADVITFGQRLAVQYPLAFDHDLTIAQAYLKNGFPTVAIINSKKRITYYDDGEIPQTTLEHQIQSVLHAQ